MGRARSWVRSPALGLGALLPVVLLACADPTHDAAVEELGGEIAGYPVGPLHRPGQPCLTCHGGDGPAESVLSIGGTVYSLRDEEELANGAQVEIKDIEGKVITLLTNAAGNFYVSPDLYDPVYPIQAKVRWGTAKRSMTTHASRPGSCADCHVGKASQTSPGHIFVATKRSALPVPGPVPGAVP
jgi:hypothetical protein